MSANAFLDACGFTPTAGGTGTWTVSAAIQGYRTPASAGAVNGAVYSYRAQSGDLTQWEEGFGTYTTSGTTLTRTVTASTNAGSAVNFTAAPNIYITALTQDLLCAGTSRSANTVLAAPNGSAGAPSFRALVAADLPFQAGALSSSLGANLALNNTGAFFDVVSVAQGSTGTWFVCATVSCQDSAGAARFDARLWDGTTTYATASNTSGGASFLCAITLCAIVTSPAGNLRISAHDANSTNGAAVAVSGGVGGCNITAFRIA